MKPKTKEEHWTALARAIAKNGVDVTGQVAGFDVELMAMRAQQNRKA